MDKQTELVERLSSQIVQWEAEIDRLKYRADTAPEDERKSCLQAIDGLERKVNEARTTLQGIGSRYEDPADDMKKGSRGILDNLRSGLRDTILKVK